MHFTLFPDYTPCLISQGAYHNIWRKTLEQGGESVITNSTHVQCQIWNPFKTTSHTAGGESVITNSTHVQCQIWDLFKTTSHTAGGKQALLVKKLCDLVLDPVRSCSSHLIHVLCW